jgi:hypothetical protein
MKRHSIIPNIYNNIRRKYIVNTEHMDRDGNIPKILHLFTGGNNLV